MPTSPSASILRHIRELAVAPADFVSDRELLERFARGRDEEAFVALLRRHGPMVWRVCRRFVPSIGDAEDAFQATFLRLARHAESIRLHRASGGHRNRVTCLAFAGNGKTLFSGADVTGDRLTEWDLATGKVARELDGARDLALSPDRRLLAALSSVISLYELPTGKVMRRLRRHDHPGLGPGWPRPGSTPDRPRRR